MDLKVFHGCKIASLSIHNPSRLPYKIFGDLCQTFQKRQTLKWPRVHSWACLNCIYISERYHCRVFLSEV